MILGMGPVVLIICDGWGIRKEKKGNAVKLAKTPNFDSYIKKYPHTVLDASGEAVGLPPGYQGNSEVGHLTLGSGRTVYQSLMRINKAIEDGSFFKNKALAKAMEGCRKMGTRLHLMGLVQDEGVHAHNDHLIALLKMAKDKGVKEVFLHAFTDGRDTPPKSASKYLHAVEEECEELGVGRIATVIGRYYAMDRDKRWIRTEKAYMAITQLRHTPVFGCWEDAVADAYENDETDEFIEPRAVEGYDGVMEGDAVIFFNYRFDRARQLTKAFVEDDFDEFHRKRPKITFVAMTDYYKGTKADVAFMEMDIKNRLGQMISRAGKRQLRISETEKYAHVTFFFNGLVEKPDKGEDRILVNSPKVATYDLKPEMSAYEQTDKLLLALGEDKHDAVIQNLVNGDMVGHTGKIKAIVKAVETVDDCLGKIVPVVLKKGGVVLITADHGNCEEVVGERKTSHTTNPVNFIAVSKRKFKLRERGTLADVAPTILKLLDIKKPEEMTGESLIV